MDKWEYLTIDTTKVTWEDKGGTSKSKELNNLGNEGWELVCSVNQYLYFRKKIKQ